MPPLAHQRGGAMIQYEAYSVKLGDLWRVLRLWGRTLSALPSGVYSVRLTVERGGSK